VLPNNPMFTKEKDKKIQIDLAGKIAIFPLLAISA